MWENTAHNHPSALPRLSQRYAQNNLDQSGQCIKRKPALQGKHDVALTLFLRGIRNQAVKYAHIRVANEDAALDILQDTMLGFAQVVGRYESDAWKNLFYKILNRRITDWLRKRTWRNKLAQIFTFSQLASHAQEQAPEPEFVGASDTESSIEAQHLAARFESELARLPDRQKQAYLLRQWQGLSVKATAEIMHCAPSSVKTHLARAMQTLREKLADWTNEKT